MRKVLIVLILLITPILNVYADGLKEYDIIDCKVFIDSTKWGIVSRDDATDDFKSLMINNNLYIYAEEPAKDSLKFELVINKTDGVSNMHTFTDSQMKESMDAVRDADAYNGKIKNVSKYETENYKFIVAEYDDSGYAFKSYVTIINGNTYAFKVYRLNELTSNDENELLSIIDKLVFNLDSYYENKSNFSSSSNASTRAWSAFLATLIVSGISLIVSKTKKKNNNVKDKENPKEETKEELKVDELNSKEETRKEKKKEASKVIEEEFVCDNCGARVKENAKKCPNCGLLFENDEDEEYDEEVFEKEKHEELFRCDNCGAIVNGSVKKCPKCGEKFEEDKEEKSNVNNMSDKYSDLKKLKELLDEKIITKDEFEKEKKKILK